MVEQTLTLIKPEHYWSALEIYTFLEERLQSQFSVPLEGSIARVPEELISLHYAEHADKPFFPRLVEQFTENPVYVRVYEGPEIVSRVDVVVGPRDPADASEDTIRGKFSIESIADAEAQNRAVANVIHRSGDIAEARREIALWARYI